MSGYARHILVYWIICAILYMGMSQMESFSLPNVYTALLSVLVGTIYTILPDIDTPSSVIRRLVEKTALAVIIVLLAGYLITENPLIVYAALAIVLLLLFLWTIKHRGIFHTLPVGLVLALPFILFSHWVMGFAFLGYATHLLVDKA